MQTIFGTEVYGIRDAVERLGPLRPTTGGPPRPYTYGGMKAKYARFFTGRKMVRHGLYIQECLVKSAQKALEARPRAHQTVACKVDKKMVVEVFGHRLVHLDDFARCSGYTPSNIRAEIYKPEGSVLRPFFTKLVGGYPMTAEELEKFVAWVKENNHLRRPHRAY